MKDKFLKEFTINNTQLEIISGKTLFDQFGCSLKIIFNKDDGYVLLNTNEKKGLEFVGINIIFGFSLGDVVLDGIYLPAQVQGMGLGKKYFKELVMTLQEIGTKKITGELSRGREYNEVGYYVRPRLGFNGLKKSKKLRSLCKKCIENSYNADITAKFQNVNDILDLMSFPEGREIWKKQGFSFKGSFNLGKNSKSVKTLFG